MQQKILYFLTGLLIIALGVLGILFYNQSQKISPPAAIVDQPAVKNTTAPTTAPTAKNQPTKEQETTIIEKEAESNQQKIVKKYAPESDLNDFKLNDQLLSAGELQDQSSSPAYNRSGDINSIDYNDQSFFFTDTSLGKEKEYQVKVDANTQIILYQTIETYDDNDNYELINSNRVTNEEAGLADLKPGDTVNINSREAFGDRIVTAKLIEARRVITKFLKQTP